MKTIYLALLVLGVFVVAAAAEYYSEQYIWNKIFIADPEQVSGEYRTTQNILNAVFDTTSNALKIRPSGSKGEVFETNLSGDMIPTVAGGEDNFFEMNSDWAIMPKPVPLFEYNASGDIIALN